MQLVTARHAGILLLAIGTACDPSTSPRLTPTIAVTIVSGDGQSAVAGTELPQPLKVRVVDATGKVLRGELVNFRVKSGGGSMYAGAALSDQQGNAQDWWTLGPTLGAQTVEVVAVDPTTGAKMNFGTFTATALAPAQLQVAPVSHGFGTVVTGSPSSAQAFQLTNVGGVPTGTIALSVGGTNASDFQVSGDACSGTTLAPGNSCAFNVTFTPGASGARSGSVTGNAAPGGSAQATLTGSGAPPANLTLTPASHDFGTIGVGGGSSTRIFNVVNTGGGGSGVVAAAIVGTDASQFSIQGNTCAGQSLLPGGFCQIGVVFQPSSAGGKTGALSVTASPGGAVGALLSGTGVVPASLAAAPSSLAFGAVYPFISTTSLTVTVTNEGGGATGALTTSLSGAAASDFHFSANTCAGNTLTPGTNCTLSVYFRPTTTGTRNATLNVSGAVSGAVAIGLTGSGSATGALVLQPTSHDFGVVALGTTSPFNVFTVQNTTPSLVGGLQLQLTGANSADFTIVPGGTCSQGSGLLAGQSCTVFVNFRPGGGGLRNGRLVVSTTSPVLSTSADLSGTGTGAQLSVVPSAHHFGNILLGSGSAPQAFTVTNVGTVASGTVSINVTGTHAGDFAATGTCGAALGPGASCQVDVTFSPGATGTRTAALVAASTPGGADNAALTGIGLVASATLAITPAAASFGSVGVGSTSGVQGFVVQNVGATTTSLVAVGLSGANVSSFQIVGNTCSGAALGPAATCTIQVLFAPNVAGALAAQLNAQAVTGGAVSAALSGTGVPR